MVKFLSYGVCKQCVFEYDHCILSCDVGGVVKRQMRNVEEVMKSVDACSTRLIIGSLHSSVVQFYVLSCTLLHNMYCIAL